jgi:hypothetical protein
MEWITGVTGPKVSEELFGLSAIIKKHITNEEKTIRQIPTASMLFFAPITQTKVSPWLVRHILS